LFKFLGATDTNFLRLVNNKNMKCEDKQIQSSHLAQGLF